MNKKKFIAVLSLLIFTITFTGCNIVSTDNHISNKQLKETTLTAKQVVQSESNTEDSAAKMIEKISRINRYYDMEQIADVFGEWPSSGDTRFLNDTNYWYEFDNVMFDTGASWPFRQSNYSAYLTANITKDEKIVAHPIVYLGLYDFDEQAMKADIAKAITIDHGSFKSDIQQAKSNGIIDSIERLDELIILLSEVKQKSTVEELVDIFGKAPKDISDGVRDKFVYYAGDITIVLYDSPFTYMELYVPGGSVKVMFSGVGA